MTGLIVHHLGRSQSERIVWLCEELGLDYELKRYDREPSGMAPPAYRALHPMGIAPVVTDGDVVLAETGAIVEYIAARYGGGALTLAPDAAAYPDYLFWLHFANGTLMPTEMIAMIVSMVAPDAGPSPLGERSERAMALAEARLGAAPWFAGDAFTLADIMMVFPFTTMRLFRPLDLEPFPNIRAYLQRVGGRPAYRRAMAKAEPGFTPMLG